MPSFGPYELLRRLGTGGMGEVFLARLCRQDRFEKLLVIKRILPQLTREEGFRAMFRREARLAALLSHQNIVQIFDYGEVDGQSFIAMEYVEGVDAATLQARVGRLTPQVVLQLLEQAARGLDYAHRKHDADGNPLGLVHRDATPRNLLVSCEGEVKWIDFGLAHALQQDGRHARIAGTVPYMSPEQAAGGALDARSDLFGLGVTAYQLFCGELPFAATGDCLEARVEAVVEGELVPLSDRGLPPELDLLVARALAADPAERYQSAREMLAAIDAVERQLGSATPHELAQLVRAHRRASESALPAAQPERTLVGDEPVAPRPDDEDEETAGDTADAAPGPVRAVESQPVAAHAPQDATRLRPWHLGAVASLLVVVLGVWAALAGSVARDEDAAEAARAEPGPQWSVTITSQPAGATVLVDGEVAGQTPLFVGELAPRATPLSVRVEAERHEPAAAELVLGPEGGTLARDFELVARKATLVVEVEPATAAVTINGSAVALDAPLQLAPGPQVLIASAPGYRTHTALLELEPAGALRHEVRLEAEPSDLRIDVLPLDAQVTVHLAGAVAGELVKTCTGPCIVGDLAPGAYVVEAARAGFASARERVELAPGEQRSVQVRCQAHPSAKVRPVQLRARGGHLVVGRSERSALALSKGTFVFRGGASTVTGSLERARDGEGMLLSLQPNPYTRFVIDGNDPGKYVAYLPLGRGRHRVRLAGAPDMGFDITVP